MKIQYLLTFTAIILSCNVFGQMDGSMEPPSEENTYYFSIEAFNRQPEPPKYIMDGINTLSKKPNSTWSQKDSLFSAYKHVHLEDFGMALNIFLRLNTDTIKEPHALSLYHTALFRNQRYSQLKDIIVYKQETPTNDIRSKENIRRRILNVYIRKANQNWIRPDSIIFPFLRDSALISLRKSRKNTKEKLVPLMKNIDEVLRIFVLLNDDKDVILSQAYQELSDFQHEHFYVTNAYIYNRIALNYNKNNSVAVQNSNKLKDELTQKNYLSPSFRTIFGKVISNRFHLKEIETAEESTDNSMRVKKGNALEKPKKKVKKDYIPWLDSDLIIVIGLFILLLLVMIILKPVKSND